MKMKMRMRLRIRIMLRFRDFCFQPTHQYNLIREENSNTKSNYLDEHNEHAQVQTLPRFFGIFGNFSVFLKP